MLRPTGGWGYNSDTEILFPMRVARQLRESRGRGWQLLVDQVIATPEGSLERLGFSLLFVHLSGCLTCHADSYRAMRGCTICATQTIRRFRGEDEELISLYNMAKDRVALLLENPGQPAELIIEQ